MDRQTILLGATVFFLASGISLLIGLEYFGVEDRNLYSSDLNTTVETGNYEDTLEFDDKSLEIVFDPYISEAYIVLEDGSELVLELDSEGEEKTGTQIVTIGSDSYRLSYRYMINSESYLSFTHVQQI